jgi:hypothetical protein
MIIEKLKVLKGRYLLAQGKRRRSVALGWETITKIVRAIMAGKEKFSFRTKWMISCFPENYVLQFRPKQDFHLLYFSLTDGLTYAFITRGVAPGYAILPLQGEEIQKLHSNKNRTKY